eukprot:scaffold7153_cov115-Isochrysis_galbana.AAC.8
MDGSPPRAERRPAAPTAAGPLTPPRRPSSALRFRCRLGGGVVASPEAKASASAGGATSTRAPPSKARASLPPAAICAAISREVSATAAPGRSAFSTAAVCAHSSSPWPAVRPPRGGRRGRGARSRASCPRLSRRGPEGRGRGARAGARAAEAS